MHREWEPDDLGSKNCLSYKKTRICITELEKLEFSLPTERNLGFALVAEEQESRAFQVWTIKRAGLRKKKEEERFQKKRLKTESGEGGRRQ